ncbi:MAG: hypothetical protein ACLQUZ_02650 [Rhizomicrobium sp.]
MLFRALFWIAVVSVLMPHEPDLGLGRPGAHDSLLQSVSSWVGGQAAQSKLNCRNDPASCRAGWSLLDSFQSVTVRSLSEVKADIEEQERARLRQAADSRAD